MIWHSTSAEMVADYFHTDLDRGLSVQEAANRLETVGENRLSPTEAVSFLSVLKKQFKQNHTWLIVLTAVFAFTVLLIYDRAHCYLPLLALPVFLLHFISQIYVTVHNQRSINKLKSKANPRVHVRRDGLTKRISAALVVPGDLLVLEPGEYICADARLLSAVDFHCDETFVTGETTPVQKFSHTVLDDMTAIEDRNNMVFCGSNVLSGHAIALVTETGTETHLGKTVAMSERHGQADQKLKEKFASVGKKCNWLIVAFCALVFVLQIVLNNDPDIKFIQLVATSLIRSCALLISVLPEGLPLIVTTAMTNVSTELLKHQVLVKHPEIFDGLNNTTVICADKSGVLTKDSMSVQELYCDNDPIDLYDIPRHAMAQTLLRLASLCTNQTKDDTDNVLYNDPTELAILNCCMNALHDQRDDFFSRYPRLCKVPFDGERKCMTSVNMIDQQPVALVKGAPGYVLERCIGIDIEALNRIVETYTARSLRVIAVAMRSLNEIPSHPTAEGLERDLTFVGLIALSDPLRKNIVEQIETAQKSGIRTLMCTGDHVQTAASIARRLGILKDGDHVMTGDELHNLTDDELQKQMAGTSVFARLIPGDKYRIVQALQANGEQVAVTGDSVADATALSIASVGFAMGNSGTDVARGAADIILNDQGYAGISHTISSARRLFTTLRKILAYLLASNAAELFTIFLALCMLKVLPLSAAALLFVNLLTDYFPVAALIIRGTTVDQNVNTRSADSKKLFTVDGLIRTAVQTIMMTIVGVCSMGFVTDPAQKGCVLFVTMICTQLFNTITMQSEQLLTHPFKNKRFYVILGICFIPVLIISLTPIAGWLGLVAISFAVLLKCLCLSVLVPVCGELVKAGLWLYRKKSKC